MRIKAEKEAVSRSGGALGAIARNLDFSAEGLGVWQVWREDWREDVDPTPDPTVCGVLRGEPQGPWVGSRSPVRKLQVAGWGDSLDPT